MEKVKLEFTHDKAVANIVLDDGKGNVLDSAMMVEILDILDSFKGMRDIKLITFQGAGKHFSFGASVQEHTKACAEEMVETFHKIFTELADLSIPTMAKVSGQCLGGGMELALACNFIFADKTAVFGQPEIVLGVFAPPASLILPMKIGCAKAEEILLTGKIFDAEESLSVGLINQIFENKSTLEGEVNKWILKMILPKSASSLRFAVSTSRVKFNETLRTGLPQLKKIYVEQLMETRDANEGINAFLEKRQPVWQNC